MSRSIFATTLALTVGVAAVAVAVADKAYNAEKPAKAETATATVGEAAPDFTLMDEEGNEVTLADFEGKVVVLEWTNPDCPFVVRHYSDNTMTMKNLAAEYADEDVVWLAVNSTHYFTQAKNKEWRAKHELPFPILSDVTGETGHKYAAKTTPHMFIVGSDGTLLYDGAIDDSPRGGKSAGVNYVKSALDQVIAGEAVATSRTKPYGCSVKYAKKANAS